MPENELVTLVVKDDCATIALNSQSTRNALSPKMLSELLHNVNQASKNSRVIVLTHVGDVFCAGLDLKSAVQAKPDLMSLELLIESLQRVPQPTIACVDGAVRAGGIALASACDLVVVSPDVSFAFTEVLIGAVPALVSAPVFRRVTPIRMTEAFLTGNPISADQALAIGLVNAVDREPRERVRQLVGQMLSAGPQALRQTTKLLREARSGSELPLDELRIISETAFSSPEAQEGIRAFLEKRPPEWSKSLI